jgi:hypothetical protein
LFTHIFARIQPLVHQVKANCNPRLVKYRVVIESCSTRSIVQISDVVMLQILAAAGGPADVMASAPASVPSKGAKGAGKKPGKSKAKMAVKGNVQKKGTKGKKGKKGKVGKMGKKGKKVAKRGKKGKGKKATTG